MTRFLRSAPRLDRREFIQRATVATAAVSTVGTGGVTWAGEANDRLNLAIVGTGGMGREHLNWFRQQPDVRVVALCDVAQPHLDAASALVPEADTTADFREVVGRDDVDAVLIATPDHWHALVAVAAAKAGKHLYCEKPLANSIGEGRAIVDAVHQANVVLQTGCHERSSRGSSIARQAIEAGRLGDVHTVRIRLPNSDSHLQEVENFTEPPPDTDPPPGLDYDFWLGHTPIVPYNSRRCHFWWRFHSKYGGGEMTDRGAHVIDLSHYLLGLDGTGPIHVEAEGRPPRGDFFDAFITFRFASEYPGGLKITGDNNGQRGLTLVGSEGELTIDVHGCHLTPTPTNLLHGLDAEAVEPYTAHRRGWLNAIRGGAPVIAPADAGHRTASACHLNNLAMKLGKPIDWDPVKERSSDTEVNSLLTPMMRPPWAI